jgi:hypothetical protein
MSGQILDDSKKPVPSLTIKLVDENDSVIATTITDKNGYFTFHKLAANKNYLLKVEANDDQLKHAKNLYLADQNGRIVRDFDNHKKGIYYFDNLPADLQSLQALDLGQIAMDKEKSAKYSRDTASMPKSDADFTRYFAYNVDKVNTGDADFAALINKIADKAANGNVTLTISGSASKVPTHIFMNSNASLADHRANDSRDKIEKALKAKQVDMSKITIKTDHTVQGPNYEHDAADQVKYEKFQYVKIYIH